MNTTLQNALLYLKMRQLTALCKKLDLDTNGKKGELIERITTFVTTGKKTTTPQIPAASKAQRGKVYPLAPETVMLFGSYTNNLATRNFFKQLIGDHFHFTAYGIDWLNERWMASNPPTYQEFADFWEAERVRRKKVKPDPKEEWAYINFLQAYYAKYPKAPKGDAMAAWKAKQQEMAELVWNMLNFQ